MSLQQVLAFFIASEVWVTSCCGGIRFVGILYFLESFHI
jgi:hypothetical protein